MKKYTTIFRNSTALIVDYTITPSPFLTMWFQLMLSNIFVFFQL